LLPDAGTKVAMQAGTQVNLVPPFSARNGTQFKAYTGPCGGGGVPLFRLADSTNMIPFTKNLMPTDGKSVAPFVTVETMNVQNRRASVKINIKQPGTVKYAVTNERGDILIRSSTISAPAATIQDHEISLAALPRGQYYVHVFHNDRWVHFQELESN
jgi:hypothetical protein